MDGGSHWRNLVNTVEPSMRGGDAALCQITLTTCVECYPHKHYGNTRKKQVIKVI